MGCHSLLQGIFLTQGSNLGLLHCRQNPLQSEPPGKPSLGVMLSKWHLPSLDSSMTSLTWPADQKCQSVTWLGRSLELPGFGIFRETLWLCVTGLFFARSLRILRSSRPLGLDVHLLFFLPRKSLSTYVPASPRIQVLTWKHFQMSLLHVSQNICLI